MFQQVIIIGNLGQDPELRHTKGGTPVATMSVATNERWKDSSGKDHEETTWHRVIVWDKLAENCAKHLGKGRQVQVVGKLRNGSYEKDGDTRYYTEIVARSVLFLGQGQGKGNRLPHPADLEDGNGAGVPDMSDNAIPVDEDIPF